MSAPWGGVGLCWGRARLAQHWDDRLIKVLSDGDRLVGEERRRRALGVVFHLGHGYEPLRLAPGGLWGGRLLQDRRRGGHGGDGSRGAHDNGGADGHSGADSETLAEGDAAAAGLLGAGDLNGIAAGLDDGGHFGGLCDDVLRRLDGGGGGGLFGGGERDGSAHDHRGADGHGRANREALAEGDAIATLVGLGGLGVDDFNVFAHLGAGGGGILRGLLLGDRLLLDSGLLLLLLLCLFLLLLLCLLLRLRRVLNGLGLILLGLGLIIGLLLSNRLLLIVRGLIGLLLSYGLLPLICCLLLIAGVACFLILLGLFFCE